jgi:hypothetical protein
MFALLFEKLLPRTVENTFTRIWRTNAWQGAESRSGVGSSLEHTAVVREELPRIFKQYGIRRFIDLPCGDFHWMQRTDLSGVDYLGIEVVEELVAGNRIHEREGVRFQQGNLIRDTISEADLVFCRDCLVHLSDAHIRCAIRNLIKSNSRYLLTTTFIKNRPHCDIKTGNWRPLNLLRPPFSFPEPLELIVERCPIEGFEDKSLGVWKLEDLEQYAM